MELQPVSRCRTCDNVGITGPPHDRRLCEDCELDFTDYGDHLTNPPANQCPLCGASSGCRC